MGNQAREFGQKNHHIPAGPSDGWPIAVVKGSGGAADAIAWVCQPENRSFFVPNPKLMEIAREAGRCRLTLCNLC